METILCRAVLVRFILPLLVGGYQRGDELGFKGIIQENISNVDIFGSFASHSTWFIGRVYIILLE